MLLESCHFRYRMNPLLCFGTAFRSHRYCTSAGILSSDIKWSNTTCRTDALLLIVRYRLTMNGAASLKLSEAICCFASSIDFARRMLSSTSNSIVDFAMSLHPFCNRGQKSRESRLFVNNYIKLVQHVTHLQNAV